MFPDLLAKLVRREDLTSDEAAAAMREVMAGTMPSAVLAALLVGLAMKGERPPEIVGFARTMRAHAVPLSKSAGTVFDTCGTGGDRSGTFNISSATAVVVAACGVRVAKHGNRSVSSQCGSADVFEELGVNLSATPVMVERCLEQAGIAFFFAPLFHPSMKHAAQTRRELGLRTAFNLLGPLTNPAGASRQVVGVPTPELTGLMAHVLRLLGTERAWVVHGADGVDEVSTHTFYIHPTDFGIAKSEPGSLAGGDAPMNAAIIRGVLDGRTGPARDVVLLNAGVGLLVAGVVPSVVAGVEQAAAAIDHGTAAKTLATMVRYSREGAEA